MGSPASNKQGKAAGVRDHAGAFTYSLPKIIAEGLRNHTGWPRIWRTPEPKRHYRVVIVGGGGHVLATAYYLARNHGIHDVAVLEKAWLGGGNTGRNTTVIRSNYYYPQSAALYNFALQKYETLSRDLNYNVMFSQRGVLTVIHGRHELEAAARWVSAMNANGTDVHMLTPTQIKKRVPILDTGATARFPGFGGFLQPRGGTARHDAVAWGYARAADHLGVDIIQQCEVTGFRRGVDGRVTAVQTTRGEIGADTVALTVAANSTALAEMAGFRLPITTYALQAFVSEPLKPVLDTVVLSTATGLYLSQSDKGGIVIGGGLDRYPSYAQRGNLPNITSVMSAVADQFPRLAGVRLLRQWAGAVDVVRDSSPIIGASPIENLHLNCGWGTGGFKAIPAGGWMLAHQIACGEPHPIARPFGLDRFSRGALIDEAAASGIPH